MHHHHSASIFSILSQNILPKFYPQATPLANNPTPNDQFQPATIEYYTNTVLLATWPAFQEKLFILL